MNDEPYQVPLGQFVAIRDALAGRLEAAGDADAAATVQRFRKPSVGAWAANQVVWHARDEWERLRKAAQTLREKHEKAAPPLELREASRERREALQSCEARAAELLAGDGHAVNPAVVQKAGHSLLALAHGAVGVAPGRLERELPPPGVEALAGVTLAAPKPRTAPAVSPAPVPRTHPRSGRETADRSTGALGNASREERTRQRMQLAAAEARRTETRQALRKARARLRAAEERRDALDAQLGAARRACDDARRQVEAAEAEEKAAETALSVIYG
jgi:hypothetical protein